MVSIAQPQRPPQSCFRIGTIIQEPDWLASIQKVYKHSGQLFKTMLAKTGWIGYTLSIKSRKRAIMTEFEKQCYGMSQADIEQEYCNGLTARLSGLEMVAMGVLSDAQELMACNTAQTQNQARQQINIAKYILSKMLEEKSSQVA